jgi:hypothetical protein
VPHRALAVSNAHTRTIAKGLRGPAFAADKLVMDIGMFQINLDLENI